MQINVPFKHKLTNVFSSQGAGWRSQSPESVTRWCEFSLSFVLCPFWWWSGCLLIFLVRTHRKNRLDLLVPVEVALFLHHLWNDGACSVHRNQSKMGSTSSYKWRCNYKLTGHCYKHRLVSHLRFKKNKQKKNTLFPLMPTRIGNQEIKWTCSFPWEQSMSLVFWFRRAVLPSRPTCQFAELHLDIFILTNGSR